VDIEAAAQHLAVAVVADLAWQSANAAQPSSQRKISASASGLRPKSAIS